MNKAVPCAPVCLADVFKASISLSDVHAEHDIAVEDAGKHSQSLIHTAALQSGRGQRKLRDAGPSLMAAAT